MRYYLVFDIRLSEQPSLYLIHRVATCGQQELLSHLKTQEGKLVKVFTDYNDAQLYSKSISIPARPPKTSGVIVPVFTFELNTELRVEDQKVTLKSFGDIEQVKELRYAEINVDHLFPSGLEKEASKLIRAEFPNTKVKEVDFNSSSNTCVII